MVGRRAPGGNPGGARPGGYPALQSTVTPPKRPVRVTVASHRPVSRLNTCRTTEAKPTWGAAHRKEITEEARALLGISLTHQLDIRT